MDFNTLKYIIEIVETGSISKASNNLFISQPTLSNHISNFEKEIGKDIFIRGNRGVVLTNYGAEVYEEAKNLINQYNIVKKKITSKTNEDKIKISSFGSPVINDVFFNVVKNYNNTNYEFELHEGGAEDGINRVANRDSDIAIIIYSPFQVSKLTQHLYHKNLELKNLFNGWMKIHISEKWNLSRKASISEADLKGLIHVKKGYLFQGMFSLDYEVNHIGVPYDNKTLITNGNKIYIDALQNLQSFGVVVDWNCKKQINSQLKRIPYEGGELVLTCAVIKRKNEILKEELDSFIDELVKAYGN